MKVINASVVRKPPKQIAFDTTFEGDFTLGLTSSSPVDALWGDGASDPGITGDTVHTYANPGTKQITLKSRSRFAGCTRFEVYDQSCVGTLPPFQLFTELINFVCHGNTFDGTLPSFSALTLLEQFDCSANLFAGALPSFAANVALENFDSQDNAFTGALPSFSACTALLNFYCNENQFAGALPSFSGCTALLLIDCSDNAFTGALPSFAACVGLQYFFANSCQFSGTLPDFSACVDLLDWEAHDNAITGYPSGCFATQAGLSYCWLQNNSLNAAAVNAILADLVTSLGLGGRVVCNVDLSGNVAPTGQGVTDAAALGDAGWTVTTD